MILFGVLNFAVQGDLFGLFSQVCAGGELNDSDRDMLTGVLREGLDSLAKALVLSIHGVSRCTVKSPVASKPVGALTEGDVECVAAEGETI